MANYKIIIPIENDKEEKLIRKIAKSEEGIEFSIGKTKNIDGAYLGELIGDLEHIIQIAGSIASLYAVFWPKKMQIIGEDGLVKNNLKIKEVITYLKKLIK